MFLIEVNAIRRSGHHAFIQWLISNINNKLYTENVCTEKINHIHGNKKILWINEGEWETEEVIKYITENKTFEVVVISYEFWEDKILDNPNYSILTPELKNKWNVEKHIHIPFVRNIYNNFASLSKKIDFEERKNSFKKFLYLHTNQLKHGIKNNNLIIYDRWIKDENYRDNICLSLLGFKNKFNPLSVGGTDSSFNSGIKVEDLLYRYKTTTFPEWLELEIKKSLIECIY